LLFMTGLRVDRENNNRTTFDGVTSMFFSRELPATLPNLMAVARVFPSGNPVVNKPLKVKLVATIDEEEAFATEHTQESITIEKEGGYVAIIPIDGAEFPKFGAYQIKFYANDKLLIERPFYVKNLKDYQAEL